MKKNFICVLFTFTFETAKWITLYIKPETQTHEHNDTRHWRRRPDGPVVQQSLVAQILAEQMRVRTC